MTKGRVQYARDRQPRALRQGVPSARGLAIRRNGNTQQQQIYTFQRSCRRLFAEINRPPRQRTRLRRPLKYAITQIGLLLRLMAFRDA